MAKRKGTQKRASGKRTTIRSKSGRRSQFVTRDSKGRIKTNVGARKSVAPDRAKRAKKRVSSGYGHQGDQRRKRSR